MTGVHPPSRHHVPLLVSVCVRVSQQVEMRLMAHLSGDPDLQRVFADGGDVFRKIAAALRGGGKKAADITVEERSQVRRVCILASRYHVRPT